MSMILSDEQIEFFRREGYLKLDAITTEAEVAELRGIYDRLIENRAGWDVGDSYDLAGTDEADKPASVPQINWPSKYAPELKETQYWRNALAVAAQLLDMEGLGEPDLIVRDHAIFKPPHHGGATPWHQDEAYWDENLDWHSLSIWMPLQPATLENGCMQFIPGSHRREVARHRLMNNDPRIVALELDDPTVDLSQAVAVPLPPGGATVHAARTLHYTSPNRSAIPRRAYILTIETPPTPRAQPRDFAWNKMRDAASGERARAAAAKVETSAASNT